MNLLDKPIKGYSFNSIKDEVTHQIRSFSFRNSTPEKKFLMFAFGRSGSELLRSLINSHPDIYCDGEIFLKKNTVFPRRYLDNRTKVYGKKIYGYKAKVYQLDSQYKREDTVEAKFFTDDFKIIYLRRKNFFRQALSVLLGHQRKIWHDFEADPLNNSRFAIDCDELLSRIETIERFEKREMELLEGEDYLYINYEKDLYSGENHQKTADRVFEYLGVESVPVTTKFHKTTPEDPSDFIENYEEVYTTIKNSEYARFLDG